jgi:hypothetical protein
MLFAGLGIKANDDKLLKSFTLLGSQSEVLPAIYNCTGVPKVVHEELTDGNDDGNGGILN